MKKLFFILLAVAALSACKKNNPTPQTITVTKTDTVYAGGVKYDTVKIVKTDTVDCIPLSDIIEGTWYNYGYERGGVVTTTSVYQIIFTDTTYTYQGSPTEKITISSDYSTIYINQGAQSGSIILNIISACSTLSFTQPSNPGTTYLLRRTP